MARCPLQEVLYILIPPSDVCGHGVVDGEPYFQFSIIFVVELSFAVFQSSRISNRVTNCELTHLKYWSVLIIFI